MLFVFTCGTRLIGIARPKTGYRTVLQSLHRLKSSGFDVCTNMRLNAPSEYLKSMIAEFFKTHNVQAALPIYLHYDFPVMSALTEVLNQLRDLIKIVGTIN